MNNINKKPAEKKSFELKSSGVAKPHANLSQECFLWPIRFYGSARRQVSHAICFAVKDIYRRMPLSAEIKSKIKNFVYKTCAALLRKTTAYRSWVTSLSWACSDPSSQEMQKRSQNNVVQESSNFVTGDTTHTPYNLNNDLYRHKHHSLLESNGSYGEISSKLPSLQSQIRLIAFYLPQFHPIPENDAWWGKGFTEWTNVTRALPQFEGHYQPHLPADLGFYDLRLPEVQRQQVEIAKAYGVSGFCFYFYWFNGKRLLELPIRQYLENRDFDLPFCLCWANENWTRKWCGLDQDVLIAQTHSAQDDILFIEHVSEYMRDSRYIRIEDKPLLIIYRPSLLPDIRKTAKRWRSWCREHGLGEIYLAYTQSFETVDPFDYGLDAAIEFPPNKSNPPIITDQIKCTNPDFKGVVYDWRVFIERSRNYTKPAYRLFRGVCPSWDNEARRNNSGIVFQNSSPSGYREWLANACLDTIVRSKKPSERLVFINAWNEWSEGAHLEPDQRYGHAWLQATRDALVHTDNIARHLKLT